MATTGSVVSYIVKIFTGSSPGTAISCLVDATLSMTAETRDVSCKDSNGSVEVLPSTTSWEMSGSGMFKFDASNGGQELWNIWKNKTLTTVAWGTAVAGDQQYVGSAYLTSLTFNAPGTNDNATFDFTFTGTGALSEYNVS
ncbi:MAG TPA: phage tail tube protein [bacterium]|nr:phage tail tube protein [bacterium]